MTKVHLAITASSVMCIVGIHTISNLMAGQAADSELASFLAYQIRWIPVNSNAVSRDAAILDTVIHDVLTNQTFAFDEAVLWAVAKHTDLSRWFSFELQTEYPQLSL